MPNAAVELRDVCKSFTKDRHQDLLVVDHVNLEIREGEFFSLLGPSGCGKTTSLRMIAGFEYPSSGEIYIHGEPMGDRPPFHRPVNTVFQNYALFPHLTVSQNVAFGLEMENLPKAEIQNRVAEVLEQVQLEGLAKRYPKQMSGGQQQRVALARALVKQPAVLLFDEPLGALDLKLRKEMQLELKRMQQRLGLTFIYVTHDQEEALTMSDRIAVMEKGKVLQVGTPMEIYEEPVNRFVADFIGETNFLTGRVTSQQGGRVVVLIDEEVPITVDCRQEMPLGKIVTLVIRPEKAEIYDSNHPSQSTLPGVVEEVVYIGTDTRYIVRLTPQSAVSVRRQNLHRRDLTLHHLGEKVQVLINSDSICILEDDRAAQDSYSRRITEMAVS
jgi:spermidine/putrescine transport system ATP-binding protein